MLQAHACKHHDAAGQDRAWLAWLIMPQLPLTSRSQQLHIAYNPTYPSQLVTPMVLLSALDHAVALMPQKRRLQAPGAE